MSRRRAVATLKKSGVLCFGVQMRQNLSEKISITFDFEKNTIAIKPDQAQGFKLAKNGEVKLPDIATALQHQGVQLPVTFLFSYENDDACWKGYVVPPMRKAATMQLDETIVSDYCNSMLIAYRWLTNMLVYSHAKTTPIEDRRAIASLALWEAICNYTPIHGAFKAYLLKEIKAELVEQNRHYVKHSPYNYLPLDASAYGGDTESPIIYDFLLRRYKNEMVAAEDKMHMDTFCANCLGARERKILRMLTSGYTEIEILDKFCMTQSELYDCCKSMGNRWTLFK